jgi:hypothetical protein
MNWEQKSLIPMASPTPWAFVKEGRSLQTMVILSEFFFQNYSRDATYGPTILAALEEYFNEQILSQRLLFHLHTHLLFYLSFGGHRRSVYNNISNNILVLLQLVL